MTKLLIVDDNPGVRSVLGYWFEQQAVQVSDASNGMEALQMAGQMEFDFALIDIGMPKMNGIELCRRLLATHLSPRPLVVWLMTGVRTAEVEAAGLAAGARAVLAKPFDCGELMAQLKAGIDPLSASVPTS
ncbi:MAG: two-component system response regulator [Verrucomicrobia bacterium]|nr:two-component system response regulator [Verrucomicrobiota bacterium]